MNLPTWSSPSIHVGALVLRLALAAIILAHGIQKATTPGLEGVMVAVMVFEIVGGILMILGLGTRIVGLLNVIVMIGAAVTVHGVNGFFVGQGGWEFVGLLSVLSVIFAIFGAGMYSLDAIVAPRIMQNRAQHEEQKSTQPQS